MPLNVSCPSCHHPFFVPDKMAGRGVKCPKCEHPFTALAVGLDRPPSNSEISLPAAPAPSAPAAPLPPPPPLYPPAPLPPPPPLYPPASLHPPASQALPTPQAGPNGNPAVVVAPPPRRPARRLTSLVVDLPVSMISKMPGQPEGVAGLAMTGLLVGLIAWGLTALTDWQLIGLVVGVLGLLLAGVSLLALLTRKQKGLGLPVAALLVNVQAIVLAGLGGAFRGGPDHFDQGDGGKGRNPVSELRRALKDQDQNARLKAAFQVGELARDLSSAVMELSTLLRDNRHTVRSAAAEALGQIGPQARLAYPSLEETAQGDADGGVRSRAADALKKIGPPTAQDVVPFLGALKSKSAVTRAAAAQGLRLIGADAAIALEALEELMQEDTEANVQVSAAQAVWALAGRRTKAAVLEKLIAGLKDFDPHVKARAALTLADMRADAAAAVPELTKALTEAQSAEVRFKAAYALEAIGKAAKSKVGELAAALKDDDVKVRLHAARALWEIDRRLDGVDVFIAALKHAQADMRTQAVLGLWAIARAPHKKVPPALVGAVPALTAALKDEDAAVRGYAAFSLAAIGPDAAPAVEPLMRGLTHPDPTYRSQCAYALMGIGAAAKKAVPALRDALIDKNGDVRLFAAQALGMLGEQADVVPTLTKLLTDEKDGRLRAKAAYALGAVRARTEAAIAALNEGLKDANNAALRAAAAEALGKIGPAARVTYPALLEVSKEEDPKIRKAATDALKSIGPPTPLDVGEFRKGLASDNEHFRAAAVVALWMLQKSARSAAADLGKLLDDPKESVRRIAPLALAAIGPDAKDAVPALAKALGRKDDEVLRARAAFALSEIGARAKAAAEDLRKVLNDAPTAVRLNAAQALWAIEEKGQELVPVLSELVEGKEEPALRVEAAELLAKIGMKTPAGNAPVGGLLRDKAVPALLKAADDENPQVRAAATVSLGSLGAFAGAAVGELMRSLEDPEAGVRAAAAEALGNVARAEAAVNKKRVRAKIAFPALIFFSKVEQNDQARRAASQALSQIGRPEGNDVGVLLEVLKDKSASLPERNAAAQALSMVGPEAKAALNDMTAVMLNDNEPGVRALLAYALGDLGQDGVPAVEALGKALEDKDAGVRAAAAFALGEVGYFAPAAARPLLDRAVTDTDPAVVQAAREGLRKIKAASK